MEHAPSSHVLEHAPQRGRCRRSSTRPGYAALGSGTDSVVAAVSSALAVKARMAPKDAAAAASALVSDFGVTDFEDFGLLHEADVMAVAASLCSVSRKKFEALWRQLGGGGRND